MLEAKTAEAKDQRKKIRDLQEYIDELRAKLDMAADNESRQPSAATTPRKPKQKTPKKKAKDSDSEEEEEKKEAAVDHWAEEGIPDEVLKEIRNEVLEELDSKYGVEVEELYLKLKNAGEQLAATREGLRHAEVDLVRHEDELCEKRVRVRRLEKQLDLEIKEHLRRGSWGKGNFRVGRGLCADFSSILFRGGVTCPSVVVWGAASRRFWYVGGGRRGTKTEQEPWVVPGVRGGSSRAQDFYAKV